MLKQTSDMTDQDKKGVGTNNTIRIKKTTHHINTDAIEITANIMNLVSISLER